MRILTVNGITKTGKTTTVEAIIKELKKRRYSVGSVKDIHYEAFTMDREGTNTHRHHQAGADMVVAKGVHETDVLMYKAVNIERIFNFFNHDWCVCEGVDGANIPKIVCGKDESDIQLKLDDITIAISGVFANANDKYEHWDVYHYEKDIEKLVDYLEKVVPHRLPNVDDACCKACGMTCHDMLKHVLKYPQDNQCVLNQQQVTVSINNQELTMVPFVQTLVRNAVLSIVTELDGYQENATIKVEFKQ